MLLAFVLSMVLILAYQLFYYMPRMKRFEEARRANLAQEQLLARASGDTLTQRLPSDSTALAPDTTATAASTAAALEIGLPIVQSEQAGFITVRTPLYEVVLTTSGAEVVSARLTGWKTHGELVQLVAQDSTRATEGLADVELLGDEQTVPLSSVAFDAYADGISAPLENGSTIVLDGSTPERWVTFKTTGPEGGVIERYYRFAPDSYVIRSGIRFPTAQMPFVRSVRWGLGPGLRTTEPNVQEDLAAMRASLRLGDEYYRKKRGTFDETYSGTVHWVALQVKYFLVALMTPAPTGGGARLQGEKTEGSMTASMTIPASGQQGRVDQSIELYMGPIDFDLLKTMGRGLEKDVEMGNKYFRPVSAAVLWSLLKLHGIIPNYGIVIILISVFTKVLFYRLTHKSFKSMRDMQALQPKLQVLKDKYKNDRQKLSQETMKLYKEAGVNPLGGCLPMLLQMPVFIALFNVLRNTIELRQAHFFGWITDLSQQDVLAKLPVTLPLIGNAVSVLPVLMGASMLVQSKIGGGIAGPESSSAQPKMLQYMLPIMFTFLFYKMPSGLVLYWLVNTVLSVAQQYYINKGAEKEERQRAAEGARKSEK